MRIRSIKPEFWRSSDTADLDMFTRLLFIGLWNYVDDNGVGEDDIHLIRSDLFPRDRNIDELSGMIQGGLIELSLRGQITRYRHVESGRGYFRVNAWHHQRINRPTDSKKPLPSSQDCEANGESSTAHGEFSEDSPPDQGSKGSREQGIEVLAPSQASRHVPPRFDDFWAAYPRRRDRRKAEKAFTNALKRADADTIIAGADRYASDPNRADQFTKYAEGWLNGDGWLDEPLPPRNNGSNVTAFERKKAANASVFQALGDAQPQRLELS